MGSNEVHAGNPLGSRGYFWFSVVGLSTWDYGRGGDPADVWRHVPGFAVRGGLARFGVGMNPENGQRRNMKLSEAIMLGSTTCEMIPHDWNSCALGCAGNAVGIGRATEPVEFQSQLMPDGRSRYHHIVGLWPWIADSHNRYASWIWRAFDNDVCDGRMTLEQLADRVREMEPSCGECNRFECSCVQKMDEPVLQEAYA